MTKFKTFLGFMLFVLVFPVTAAIAGCPTCGSSAGSIGEVTVDTNVSSWDVGGGQPNGKFVVAEYKGIEIGLRAQERFLGPLTPTGDGKGRHIVGIYEAVIGDTGENNATWNYDFHVDLLNAEGIYFGKVLADYRLVLEQDFTVQSLFGFLGFDPVELPLGIIINVCSAFPYDDTLCQQSWNPGFGNDDFDPTVPGTYNLRLVLIPMTFGGPAIAVAIQVIVNEPV
jgi:hypothetical protein